VNIEERLQSARIRMRSRHPFFGTLLFHATTILTEQIPTACTDGRNLYFNPAFIEPLSRQELDGLLHHEVLHAALLHCQRRGTRNPLIWNWAADIVVNGMIASLEDISIPDGGGLRDPALEELPVEEVYEKLQNSTVEVPLVLMDLVERQNLNDGEEYDLSGATEGQNHSESSFAALREYWKDALQRSRKEQEQRGQGTLPCGLQRELEVLENAQLDWRSLLARYLPDSQANWQGIDRRFIGQGLYLEELQQTSIKVAVCLDTSGSVSQKELSQFYSEVYGLLCQSPETEVDLYFADAELHGPYPLMFESELPEPKGGGGTDFRPFFNKLNEADNQELPRLAIYLTDGYGTYPQEPEYPVLWVINEGGLNCNKIPWGQRIRTE
jgi:predicted metal-dependent peptidase